MTVMDKVKAETRNVMNMVFDKETINLVECAALYSTISQGRYNLAVLEIMYNHATDRELRELIQQAIDEHTRNTVDASEMLINHKGGKEPSQHLERRKLHSEPLTIPEDARFTNQEIAFSLGAVAKISQTAVLNALQQSYQLDVAKMYRDRLDAGLDFNYRLMQLMLNKGWLPYIEKVQH